MEFQCRRAKLSSRPWLPPKSPERFGDRLSHLSSKFFVIEQFLFNRDVDKRPVPFNKLVLVRLEPKIPGLRTEVVYPHPEPGRPTQRGREHSEAKLPASVVVGI